MGIEIGGWEIGGREIGECGKEKLVWREEEKTIKFKYNTIINNYIIEKIREIVKSRADYNDWNYHILVVVKYALELGKIKNADLEVVEIAALLHDVGRLGLGDNCPDHEIVGQPMAEEILLELSASSSMIGEVKHCIASHRGSRGEAPRTLIAQIIANADAMSHFDSFPLFFYWMGDGTRDFNETITWVEKKLERDWEKKLIFPEAKEIVREKYDAIKVVLDANKRK